MNDSIVIAGGGIISIYAAIFMAKKYKDVTIIEKSSSIGGLLSSFQINNLAYDYGTHVPGLTGQEEIDGILFGSSSEISKHWNFFPYLKSENYFNEKWNRSSPLIDITTLENDLYSQACDELLTLPSTNTNDTNLYTFLRNAFGPTITENVYRPVFKKLLQAELEDLHSDLLRLFGLQRVVAFTPERSRELKKEPKYDSKIAYHSYTEGSPPLGYYYPKGEQGIGQWISLLTDQLKSSGVTILTDRTIKKINQNESRVTSVELNDGALLNCDNLIWSLPAALAQLALGQQPSPPPGFTNTSLFHFEVDTPILKTFPHYLLCWEPSFLSYRITLYPNLRTSKAPRHNITVEVLSDKSIKDNLDKVEAKVFQEMKSLEVIAPSAKILNSKHEFVGPSFPQITESFVKNQMTQARSLEGSLRNFHLIGRGSGKGFFINDLLKNCHTTLKEISKNG